VDYGNPAILRRQEYWTMTSGATGQLYGNHFTWQFVSGWESYLITTGTIQLGYMKELFASRAWYNLIPDQSHQIVTSGYGTFSSRGSLGSNDYVSVSSTPDGSLVIAYLPTTTTITVDMSKLSGLTKATWFDPSSNTFTPAVSSTLYNSGSQKFTPPGKNRDGDDDWVLLLETSSSQV